MVTEVKHTLFSFLPSYQTMESNAQSDAGLAGNSTSASRVTREMIRERTLAVAASNGRTAQDVWASDWEVATAELIG